MQKAHDKIWLARIVIFIIALLYAGFAVIGEMRDPSDSALRNIGIGLAMAGIFIAFGFIAKETPFAGILAAIILYILLIFLDVAVSNFSIFRGIIIRGAIIAILIRGLLVAREYEKWLKEREQG
jgi:hypothetical protein